MKLYCAICLYLLQGVAKEATTIMGGTAVCQDHMAYCKDQAVRFAVEMQTAS